MSVTAWLDRHRRSVLTLATALALAGIAAALSLPIGLYPETSFPRVRINIDAGSQPAAQMVLQTTQPIEQAVRAVPGVADVLSTTSRGSAQVTVDFTWGTDMTSATLGVNAAIAQILPDLPRGANYAVLRMTPTVFPFMAYALTSPHVSQVALQNFAIYRLVPLLSGVPGIARVQVQGGDTGEMEVDADPRRLAAFHLTLDDLVSALAAANTLQSVGRVEDHEQLYLLMAANAMRGLADVQQTVIRAGPAGVVRLDDVATVRMGVVPQFLNVDADGKRAVTLLLYQQPGTDMVTIARQVRQALAGFAPQFPPGVSLSKWYDQSTLVLAAAGSVRDAILAGIVLAAIVLLLFLRSWRITLLAVTIVPAALAAAMLVLSLLGMSFNIMTLGGLAASVGLVIDDVIVMIEHIARRSAGGEQQEGRLWVLNAGAEFFPPAHRLFGRDADRVRAARLSLRRHRRVFQGAVAHHGRDADRLLGAHGARRAAAGRERHRFQALARPGRAARRRALPPACSASGRAFPPALPARHRRSRADRRRPGLLSQCPDRLHPQSR